jgi:hypothetical protein
MVLNLLGFLVGREIFRLFYCLVKLFEAKFVGNWLLELDSRILDFGGDLFEERLFWRKFNYRSIDFLDNGLLKKMFLKRFFLALL